LSEVAFDQHFDEEVFRFVSPDGQPARPDMPPPPPEPVSFEEAARRASFTVLTPGRLPQGWSVDVTYVPPSPRRRDQVWVTVISTDGQSRLTLTETAEPDPDVGTGEPVEINGRRISVTEQHGIGGWAATAEFMGTHIQAGTHVRAQGNLDRDSLVEIVASLKPAETSIPPMTDR
jgi:hypothetical protein